MTYCEDNRGLGAAIIDSQTKAAILQILSELSQLPGLDAYRLGTAAKLAQIVETGTREEILDQYCSLEWWGGAGSMADYEPTTRSSLLPYAKLLARLAREFEFAGFECQRAAGWTTHFG